MIAKKLISKEIQTATLETTGGEALSIMQEFRLSHIAVVEDNKLLGIISEEDIWNMHDEGNKIKSISEKIEMLCMPLARDVFEIKNVSTYIFGKPYADGRRRMGLVLYCAPTISMAIQKLEEIKRMIPDYVP